MNTKKVVTLALVALVLFFLIREPNQAATGVHNVLGWLRDGAESIITFIKSLFS